MTKQEKKDALQTGIVTLVLSTIVSVAFYFGMAQNSIASGKETNEKQQAQIEKLRCDKADKEALQDIKDDLKYIRERVDAMSDKKQGR